MQSTPGTLANLRDLVQRFSTDGRVEAIVHRPNRKQPAVYVSETRAVPGFGLAGDRRAVARREGHNARKRELTLIQSEHLPNLLSMRSPFGDVRLEWQIGEEACIEVTGSCDPCSRMENELGPGGYNALRGHGGVTALILAGGVIRTGDRIRLKAVHRSPHAGGDS